ncbi:MAG: glycosyltransferase family 4 protein [Patescibacteria group bacterium]|nr:glycosyltransferase family 4 protein [Patescibacteria group bacterium]MDD5164184.1 glycosyltransferase family 4 protein [Patescibacteria group bacterium]MDD5534482.1 glycosyltransferase family 4 protein [Patescibacteria group bacterium]
MKIWILNHYAVTPDMPSGTRHYDFAKELVKRGHEVTIFASSFHFSLRREIKLTKNEKYLIENIDGINFVWIKTFPYQKNDWQRVINMFSYMCRTYCLGKKITKINKNIEQPNIIIGSSVHLLAVLSAYWLTKYYKAKFLMEVRDLWPQTLVDMGNLKENNLIVKTLRILEKFLYKKAKKIITLLPLAKKYITALGIDEKKIVWIPNGVDLTKFKNISKKETTDEKFKVMYFGAHGLANALNYVLDAARIIQDTGYEKIKFIFIGDGSEKKNLIKYKNELQLKNTEFRDSLSKDEVYTSLNEADTLIFNLKKTEVFKYGISSNKLFDYMAAVKPIIFSVNAANNPVKEADCGISISPENPQIMADAIVHLCQTSLEEREKMGQNGKEYVEKYHSIPVLVNKLEKIIQEII